MEIQEQITGAEKLTAVFGHWPDFHDSEVVWIQLDRGEQEGVACPTLETLIHTFEITTDVDANGFLVLRHHVLVHLRFRKVDQMKLEGFNHQNALLELAIRDIRDRQLEDFRFSVHFVAAHGVEATFLCHAIECVSVTPCDANALRNPDGRGLQSYPRA